MSAVSPPAPDGFRRSMKRRHNMKDLVFTQNGQVLTDSLTVAETFGKDHKDVLRAINSIDCEASFKQRNFAPLEGTYINGIGVECKRPVFNLTKDGFVLLVMGFTGKKAMAFKIKYIEAFNAMERALAAAPALDAKAIGGIVKKCAAKAVKDEIAALPAPSFNPQALVEALAAVSVWRYRRRKSKYSSLSATITLSPSARSTAPRWTR